MPYTTTYRLGSPSARDAHAAPGFLERLADAVHTGITTAWTKLRQPDYAVQTTVEKRRRITADSERVQAAIHQGLTDYFREESERLSETTKLGINPMNLDEAMRHLENAYEPRVTISSANAHINQRLASLGLCLPMIAYNSPKAYNSVDDATNAVIKKEAHVPENIDSRRLLEDKKGLEELTALILRNEAA